MMELRSAYSAGQKLPDKFANHGVDGGENISPPFTWGGASAGTKSFALVMVDHHPVANNFVHWLVVDIPPEVTSIPEGASLTDAMPAGAKELTTTYGKPGYGGPRPPVGSGDHGYETIVYALDVEALQLPAQSNWRDIETGVAGKVLDRAILNGFYGR